MIKVVYGIYMVFNIISLYYMYTSGLLQQSFININNKFIPLNVTNTISALVELHINDFVGRRCLLPNLIQLI